MRNADFFNARRTWKSIVQYRFSDPMNGPRLQEGLQSPRFSSILEESTHLIGETTLNVPTPLRLVSLLFFASVIIAHASGEPATSSDNPQMKFFETRIRPLLIEQCFECHSGDETEGGLRLDGESLVSEGGDSGPAVVAGLPEKSLLVSAIRYEELEMPPDAPLSAQEQADIERWVREGAYWPEPQGESVDRDSADATDWWAAQPLAPGRVPDASPSVRSHRAIDRYVDRRLDESGLHRAPEG